MKTNTETGAVDAKELAKSAQHFFVKRAASGAGTAQVLKAFRSDPLRKQVQEEIDRFNSDPDAIQPHG